MFFKKNAATVALLIIIASSVVLPLVASAYTTPNLWGNPPGFWGPLVSCTGNYLTGAAATAGVTPCASLCDVINTFINIVYFVISIALFIITPIAFLVGAVMIMVAGANPEMLGSGKKVLTGTVIGLIIILCSYLIVNTVLLALNVTAVGGFNGNSVTCSAPASSSNSTPVTTSPTTPTSPTSPTTPTPTPTPTPSPTAPYGSNSD